MRLKREIGSTWHKHFITNGPVIVFLILWPTRVNLVSASFNFHLSRQLLSLTGIGRARLYLGPNQNLTVVPTLHSHAAILATIDGKWAATWCECLFSDFAVSNKSIPVPIVVATS